MFEAPKIQNYLKCDSSVSILYKVFALSEVILNRNRLEAEIREMCRTIKTCAPLSHTLRDNLSQVRTPNKRLSNLRY
jgi:hypothetical protein